MTTAYDAAVLDIAQRILEARSALWSLPIAWSHATPSLKQMCLEHAVCALEGVRPAINYSPRVVGVITPNMPYGERR